MMIKYCEFIYLNELAEFLSGKVKGENIPIYDVAGIDDVEPGEITWVEDRKSLDNALLSRASALIISEKLYEKHAGRIGIPCILVEKPRVAFARALKRFWKRSVPARGISATARVGANTTIGKDVSIGEYTIVGENSIIGDDVTLYAHVYVGDNVKIGRGTIIYPFAAIHSRSIIGEEVIIHSGAVIGADGFGFVEDAGRREKIPQVGIVILGNQVEIGANVTIDRATTGATMIGDGTKIDNLIQIGHNNRIGKNCILVSQSGVAGSCEIGDNVTLAAQSGVAPHVKIGSNTVVGGRGGVTHDIPENSVVSGFPAKPHKEALSISAATQRLPILMKTIKELENRVKKLEDERS